MKGNKMDNRLITFTDICIESQYSDIDSREKDCDIQSDMNGVCLKLPIIAANMPYICEDKMAVAMAFEGGLGIIHRFMPVQENVNLYKKSVETIKEKYHNDAYKHIGVSLGVKDDEKDRFEILYREGARLFCIDIAHGHSHHMKEMIKWIRRSANDVILIAGNIATKESALDMLEWGGDKIALKVGIGPGSVCRTRTNTGVGKPQFAALMEIRERVGNNVFLMSDGGTKTSGDFAKALIYADVVMTGAALAGTTETPGQVYPVEGTDLTNRQYYKLYGGSASAEAKIRNGQEVRFVEGEMKRVPFKGHVKYILKEISDGIKSAMSYSGSRTLQEYKNKVKWSLISENGRIESKI